MSTLIEARGLTTGYGKVALVRDIDLRVDAGEVVALFGANGAGKTTTLLTLAGELAPLEGEVHFLGSPTRAPMHARCRQDPEEEPARQHGRGPGPGRGEFRGRDDRWTGVPV